MKLRLIIIIGKGIIGKWWQSIIIGIAVRQKRLGQQRLAPGTIPFPDGAITQSGGVKPPDNVKLGSIMYAPTIYNRHNVRAQIMTATTHASGNHVDSNVFVTPTWPCDCKPKGALDLVRNPLNIRLLCQAPIANEPTHVQSTPCVNILVTYP